MTTYVTELIISLIQFSAPVIVQGFSVHSTIDRESLHLAFFVQNFKRV